MRNGLLIAPILLAMVGCTTYINIPAQPGDVAVHDPNDSTVVEVEAAALAGLLSNSQLRQPGILLPEGTTAESYQTVLKSLGTTARADAATAAATVHVRQVRVRGRGAEVDIVIPAPGAAPGTTPATAPAATPAATAPATPAAPPLQLVTSYLNWEPIAGWQSIRLRYWRIPVDDALLKSRAQVEPDKDDSASEPPPEPQKPGNN